MAKHRDFNHLDKWLPVQIERTGLPMFKIANRAGISRASFYSWFNDKTRPDSETMLKVVQVIAAITGDDSAKMFAEALSQYVQRPEGRKSGADWAPAEARVRSARKR